MMSTNYRKYIAREEYCEELVAEFNRELEVFAIDVVHLYPEFAGETIDGNTKVTFVGADGRRIECHLREKFTCENSAARISVFANEDEELQILLHQETPQ